MAAYACTVTVDTPRAQRISRDMAMITGELNLTNYNSTLAAITNITKYFKSVKCVVFGISDAGYLFEWVDASNAAKAYQFNYAQATAADGPAIEASDDVDVGAAKFVAYGLL